MTSVTVYITPSELEKYREGYPVIVSKEPNYSKYNTLVVEENYLQNLEETNTCSLNPGGKTEQID
ncbi:hypothetical protein [Exiguobacterium sp. s78]|uniref:hypothetical protein n=1 Tax=Exiguobacterium sp. s78 TaxID=2751197 RepID=UPI001BE62D1F|nr:hypothetical protein [Exiguobacterium sp. s78]